MPAGRTTTTSKATNDTFVVFTSPGSKVLGERLGPQSRGTRRLKVVENSGDGMESNTRDIEKTSAHSGSRVCVRVQFSRTLVMLSLRQSLLDLFPPWLALAGWAATASPTFATGGAVKPQVLGSATSH